MNLNDSLNNFVGNLIFHSLCAFALPAMMQKKNTLSYFESLGLGL